MKYYVSLTLAILLATGCQKKPSLPKSQELRLNIHSDPPSLDSRKAIDSVSASILKMCFEGLMTLNATGEAVPSIAKSYQLSTDHKTYTFFLNNAQWSDGTEVTAFDFEYAWKTILSPTFHSESASELYIIKNGQKAKMGQCGIDEIGIKALDAKTLQVELTHPVPYFLELTASYLFFPVPKHIVEKSPNWADSASSLYVSNGPFLLKTWQRNNKILLEKNETYWDKEVVQLTKISFSLIEDENTELALFENQEIDWSGTPFSSLPLDALPSLKKKEKIISHPISGTYYYVFNTKQFPFNNRHIRRAFSLAINRQMITENITQSGELPAMALIPPTMWKEDRNYFKDHDAAQAKKELQLGLNELGITIEELPTLTLSYNTLSSHHKIAQAIQEQWLMALGIKVKLENKEWKVFLDTLSTHQFQIARMGGSAGFNDPTAFLDLYRYLSSSNNYPQWTNSQFTDLLEQADLCTDTDKRTLLLKQAEKIFITEMPIAPIYFYTASYIKQPYLKRVSVSTLSDVDIKNAYMETQ